MSDALLTPLRLAKLRLLRAERDLEEARGTPMESAKQRAVDVARTVLETHRNPPIQAVSNEGRPGARCSGCGAPLISTKYGPACSSGLHSD